MTRTTKTRRTPRKAATPAAPRDFLLAGIGAVSLGRKQAIKSIEGFATGADTLRERADAAARQAGSRVAKFRKQAQAKLAPVQKQATAFAAQAQAEFEARFAPVLAKLGLAPAKAKRPARAAKRVARPAAKRARKRA